MKVKSALLVLLVILATDVIAQPLPASPYNTTQTTAQSQDKAKTNELVNAKYLGYSMDGITSASKLAAQRSHTVAGEDERDFAIFTGIVAILIIIFLSQIEFNKN